MKSFHYDNKTNRDLNASIVLYVYYFKYWIEYPITRKYDLVYLAG